MTYPIPWHLTIIFQSFDITELQSFHSFYYRDVCLSKKNKIYCLVPMALGWGVCCLRRNAKCDWVLWPWLWWNKSAYNISDSIISKLFIGQRRRWMFSPYPNLLIDDLSSSITQLCRLCRALLFPKSFKREQMIFFFRQNISADCQ